MRDYRKWARTWISVLLSARALRKILYLSSWQFHLCIVKGIIDDIIKTVVKTAEVNEQKTKYLLHFINKHDTIKLNRDIHFTCILHLLNNTCVKHNYKSVHVSNLFWSREYNSAKEICKYPSFSKVGGNYPLDLKIIWSPEISQLLLEKMILYLIYGFCMVTCTVSPLSRFTAHLLPVYLAT